MLFSPGSKFMVLVTLKVPISVSEGFISGSPYCTSFRYSITELIPDADLTFALTLVFVDLSVEFGDDSEAQLISGAPVMDNTAAVIVLSAVSTVKYLFSDVVVPSPVVSTRFILFSPASKLTVLLTINVSGSIVEGIIAGSPYKISFRYSTTELRPEPDLIFASILALAEVVFVLIFNGLVHRIIGPLVAYRVVESFDLKVIETVKYLFSDVVVPSLFVATK